MTGTDGGSYEKVTTYPMCTELGDRMRMINYVEKYGNTILCSVKDGLNCNEQEVKYLEKWKDAPHEDLRNQYDRLENMTQEPMKDALRLWAYRRMRILKHLLALYRQAATEL